MCGIGGISAKTGGSVLSSDLDSIQASLIHRGPDAKGRLVVGNVGLVSTRLAIVDLVHGDQPLFSSGGAALVANAEIYNAPEIRADFPDYSYKTASDCEAIFPLYEKYGLEFADHLRGMYAIAILDPLTQRLILARDPFGIKPLYYVQNEGFFAFASEIGALLDAGFAERDIDDASCREYLQHKYVTTCKTIIPDVRRLEPGETIVVEDGSIREARRNPGWPRRAAKAESQSGRRFGLRPPRSLVKKFDQVLHDSVAVHLRGDVPWTLFLSGGVDSTILMLAARKVSPTPVRALTIGYSEPTDFDESRTALKLAHGLGIACDRLEMGAADFWALAPRIAAAADDPIADPALIPLYMLGQEAARRGDKVAISGEGADEIFGGYSRYRRATLPRFLKSRHGRRGVFSGGPIPAHRFEGWDRAMDALEREQQDVWTSRLQVAQALDVLERLPNCLLIKLDRALMAHSVEGRTPFLDREMVRFAISLPDAFKANPFIGKRLLRDWLNAEYPQAQPYARKRGFDVPLGAWMYSRRKELAVLVSAQPAIARLAERDAVHQIFEHCADDAQPAWSLLFYALWHSHHILGVSDQGNIASVLRQSHFIVGARVVPMRAAV